MVRNAWHFQLLLVVIVCGGIIAGDRASAESSPHAAAMCASCHEGGGAPGRNADALTAACLDCHKKSNFQQVGLVESHGADGRHCQDCHMFHEPTIVNSPVGEIDLGKLGQAGKAHCAACHDKRGDLHSLSPAHQVAAFLYHDDVKALQETSPSEACLNCHSNLTATNWQAMAPGKALAFNQHASHPYGVRVIPGKGDTSNWIAKEIDPRIPLFEGRLECQSCHLLTAGNDDLMIPFPAKYDLCKGCHRHYGDEDEGEGREPFATMVQR